ncbi:restriction endonuclease subunit S [Nitrosomonas halophila]|uniref:Type I restriction enzyme, S subunit n=1 Tax=Nitrosomonas halophila TaxID=44576 RepID=A0A1H3C559_9PROT|nr:restriction endonuclease subunit S [Nitrosomonas halophila]SDX49293.1 type I restriction enzyme, S subunit [Nitrosomonas halophila]
MTDSTRNLLEQHFDTAFAAPDGIARLRELILTLAMQGKLVEQDSNDPHASELLKEIEAEKQRLVKAGKIKKPKPLPPINPEEVPYELPPGWEWVRLGEVAEIVRGVTYSKSQASDVGSPGTIELLRANNINGTINFLETLYVPVELVSDYQRLQQGDILIAMSSGSPHLVGKAAPFFADRECTFGAFCGVIRASCERTFTFLHHYCQTPLYRKQTQKEGKGIGIQNLNKGALQNLYLALPPIPEQQRIVARIDQLMARCDALEKLRKQREEKRLAVHAAAIKQLLDPALRAFVPSCEPFDFLAQHFGELYTVKENVAELRKAILQLAVMGRLVPQDPNDPPASELLKEIEAEKQRLSSSSSPRRRGSSKPLPPIKPEEVPYELPQGWEWVRLGNTILNMDAGWSPKCESEPARDNEWGVLKTTAVQTLQFWPYENKALPEKLAPRPDTQVEENDILITRAGPKNRVGICCVAKPVHPKIMLSDKIIRFKIYGDLISPDYCALALNTGYGAEQIERMKSGMADSQMNISQDKVKQVIVAIPPLPEQHRIVARIDQLMALCNTLDKKIDAATDKQTEFLNAAMAQV